MASFATFTLVSKASMEKAHKLGVLKQQIYIVSQFWKLYVQNKGVIKAMLPLRGFLPWNPSLSLSSFWEVACNPWCSLAYRCIAPIPPFCDFLPACFCLRVAVFL